MFTFPLKKKLAPGRFLVAALLVAALVWAVSLACGCESAKYVWHFQGSHLLSDYYYPWVTAHDGWWQEGALPLEIARWDGTSTTVSMQAFDRCYPAFALIPYRFLPYGIGWAAAMSLLGAAALLWTLGLVCGRGATRFAAGRMVTTLVALAGTFPFLHALERCNQIWFAAAAATVFLAWYDDARPLGKTGVRRSWVAAICLAVAFCLKISPVVLGIVYLPGVCREVFGARMPGAPRSFETCRLALLSAGVALVLFCFPWPWFGGLDGFRAWLSNAAANQQAYCGAFAFLGCARGLMGGLYLAFAVGVSLGHARGRRSAAIAFAVVGMMMVANLHFYGGLYLLPVCLLRLARMRTLEAILWFCALQPVQVSIGPFHPSVYLATLSPVFIPWCALWYNVRRCR